MSDNEEGDPILCMPAYPDEPAENMAGVSTSWQLPIAGISRPHGSTTRVRDGGAHTFTLRLAPEC